MKKIFFILFLLSFLLSSCQKLSNVLGINFDSSLTYPNMSMENRYFYADYRKQGDRLYNFYKIAEYDKLIVYVKEGSGYNQESVNYIANEFNNNYDEEVRIYGEHTDVDKNGKIIILLLELNASYSGSITTGYFYGADLILNQNNNAEILYMDIKKVNEDPEYMSGTIQHEFQHLINFNVNYIENGREISTWLNEALSESTSILFSPTIVSSRINEFNNHMSGYYCFYTWNLPLNNIFANYPSVSVFVNWLYKRNGNNSSVFQNIAKYSSAEDYSRVLNNVSFIGSSSWEDLLLKWIEGLKNNEVAGAKLQIQPSESTISLFPGAAVAYSGSIEPSGNLVIKDLGNGYQVALNKDTYIGNNPTYINITTPKVSSVQASKMYETANDKPYTPKEIPVLFDKDGKIKEY
ncbi:peptidase M30 [Brachyspira catarrhinii]|uniref:Peptidase M30 n=2 Tax=Brachyspira catarrhinii TaxID=2528966 RepID=A0ABY2TMU7_9SPIR|nr:peptidase M30 [Brachyspira catarrhinii]TKZ28955.1 peptidase M30 [Brachyspira catarrhinii]